MKNERTQGKGSFQRTAIITLALFALGAAAMGMRRHEPHTAIVVTAPAPSSADAAKMAIADDGSDMIGEAEPLLVGTPSPRKVPVRTARR